MGKGTNQKKDWSKSQAGLDALEHFLWDCKDKLNEDILNEINGKYKKPLLIEKITENLNNKYYKRNQDDFYRDLRKLEEIGISDEISYQLWSDYYELIKEPNIWGKTINTIKNSSKEILIGIITGTITGVSVFLIIEYIKKQIT